MATDDQGGRSRLVTLLSRRMEALDRATTAGVVARPARNGSNEGTPASPGTDARDAQQDERPDQKPEGRTAAEWVTLVVSLVIVVLMIGAALYEHGVEDEPPGVRVAVTLDLAAAEERDGLTHVPWTVENNGQDPAEAVVILFEITAGEETVQESTAEIAFLPNGGTAKGELVTDLDLATHTISAQVVTFQLP